MLVHLGWFAQIAKFVFLESKLLSKILRIKRWMSLMVPNLSRPESRQKVRPRARTVVSFLSKGYAYRFTTPNPVCENLVCEFWKDVFGASFGLYSAPHLI